MSPRLTRLSRGSAGSTGRAFLGFATTFATVAAAIVGVWWALVAITAPPPFLLPGPDRVA